MKHRDYKRADEHAPTLRASLADRLRAVAFDLTDVADELRETSKTITDATAPEDEEQKP